MRTITKILTLSHRVIFGFHLAALKHLAVGQVRAFLRCCSLAFHETGKIRNYELDILPEANLADLLGSRTVKIHLCHMPYEEGMMPSHEAMALLSIMASEKPAAVLEIGTFMGHTTKAMAENLPDCVIHTVDLPLDYVRGGVVTGAPAKDDYHLIQRRVVGREFVNTPLAGKIVQHFGDTAVWDFAAAGHPNCFFIDGSHTYEHCKSDSEKCLGVAAPGAVFLWHDCDQTHTGVTKFLAEWRKMGRAVQRIGGTSLAYWRSGETVLS